MTNVLDFSSDSDDKRDSNGHLTSASLNVGPFPKSFTICSAFRVMRWNNYDQRAPIFALQGHRSALFSWGHISVRPTGGYTEFTTRFGTFTKMQWQSEKLLFPLQWTQFCASLASGSNWTLVVDGQLLGVGEYKYSKMPDNLFLFLGATYFIAQPTPEAPIQIADLNVFNSSLHLKQMIGLTSPGEEECGAAGDLLNWEEAKWTLHSEAKVVKVDRDLEGPCRKKSKLQLFKANFKRQDTCMHHCQKIAWGRSPPVNTAEDWETLSKEIKLMTSDYQNALAFWLSATRGTKKKKLKSLPHWPETEKVNNKTVLLKAGKSIWRDFYTGQRLDNTTEPFLDWTRK